MVGYAFCGSYCTIGQSLSVMSGLRSSGFDILPIMSENEKDITVRGIVIFRPGKSIFQNESNKISTKR